MDASRAETESTSRDRAGSTRIATGMLFDFIETIKRRFPADDTPFLRRQCVDAARRRPYAGLRLLHHVPFTPATVLKLEPLLRGGAELVVSSPGFMTPDEVLVADFVEAGGDWRPRETLADFDCDIAMDCAGELSDVVHPRLGVVELTGSGTHRYSEARTPQPVVSIDLSRVKALEAVLGTGEAFVRAYRELTRHALPGRVFLVFGYGKVGRGIAQHLRAAGAEVVVAEVDATGRRDAQAAGFVALDARDRRAVERAARAADTVVTATGREQIVSRHYDADCFRGRTLANMGGGDEFGADFDASEVLCAKRPINFFVEHPTRLRYLDPVFYAHNLGAELLRDGRFGPGVHPFPAALSDAIVHEWEERFDERVLV